MSSKSIYHYVYRITNIIKQKHYYGKRTSHIPPNEDLGILYFSSSTDKDFILDQKTNRQNYKYKIIRICSNDLEAIILESFLHNKFDVSKNPNFYNRVKQNLNGFDSYGKVFVQDKDRNLLHVSVDDPRYLSGELVHIHKNKIIVKDKNNNNFMISNTDPRYLSGELVHFMANKTVVKDNNGNTFTISVDDSRIKSGELVGIMAGKITAKDKNGNIFSISSDDPRYLSGELVHISKGFVAVKDKNGNIYSIPADDPRYLSGELVGIMAGKTVVKDKTGNTFAVSVDDSRYLSGELVHINAGKTVVKDKNGNKFSISSDDPRIKSGELVGILKGLVSGKNNPRSKYVYITPFGEFEDLAMIPNIIHKSSLIRWCINCNRKISIRAYCRSNWLKQNYSFNELQNKTYKDIGFYTNPSK